MNSKIVIFALLALCVLSKVPEFPLHNAAQKGMTIPAIGLGTGGYGVNPFVGYGGYPECWITRFPIECGNGAKKAIGAWLDAGGVRIDNANSYYTQDQLGDVLAERGLNKGAKRDSVWLLSKVGNTNPMGYNDTLDQVEWILRSLQVDYVDIILNHWPTAYPNPTNETQSTDPVCNTKAATYDEKECRLSTWRALIKVFNEGKAKAIGVSNYNQTHIQEIIDAGLILPAASQNHFNIYSGKTQMPKVEFFQKHNITYISYSPLGIPDWHKYPVPQVSTSGITLDEPKVLEIAEKYNKTTAQVMLQWQYSLGIPSNPRSMNQTHMEENLNSFDFELTAAEKDVLLNFPQDTCKLDPNYYEACGGNILF